MDKDIYAMAAQMAAGALAGGVVATPGDAVAFAAECYDLIMDTKKQHESDWVNGQFLDSDD